MMAVMYSLSIDTKGIWRPLKAGDRVDVVAPARQGKKGELPLVREFLNSWGLEAHIPDNLIGEDLLCANTDSQRYKFLIEALNDSNAAAVWCLRGGYGSARLMPELLKQQPVTPRKWFIGFSDITILHSWLNTVWRWPTLHAYGIRQLATGEVDERSLNLLKGVLFGTDPILNYSELELLNDHHQTTNAMITGGNLCVLENTIGTPWQFDCKNKILLLEEVNEMAYRVDRSLNHLRDAQLIQEAAAIILGDFMPIDPAEEQRVNQVLQLFAEQCTCPVYRLKGIGHGNTNLPLPFAVTAKIS